MYRLNDAEVFFDMTDGQAVMINFVTGIYYATTALGSEITRRLIDGADISRIIEAVKAVPGCPRDFEERCMQYVKELTEKAILIPTDDASAGGDEKVDPEICEAFELSLEEYSDVKDLLLADPVHETDEQIGWPVMKEEQK